MIPHAWRIFNRLDNTSECPMEKALKGCFELSATSDPLTRIPGHMPLSCMIRWTYPIYSVNLLLWICWSEFEEQQKSIVCAQSSNGGLAGLFYWLKIWPLLNAMSWLLVYTWASWFTCFKMIHTLARFLVRLLHVSNICFNICTHL